MTRVDQFESVFRAAARPVFTWEHLDFPRVLRVTDRQGEQALREHQLLRGFLRVLDRPAEAHWIFEAAGSFESVGDLLALVERHAPDLICTHRHLRSPAWRWPYSLGEHLDILLQRIPQPVLVLPHPERDVPLPAGTLSVLALTDRLPGDHRLVNVAVRLTDREGVLRLIHVEDAHVFERYMDIIEKLPAIDTETAREAIRTRLLAEPEHWLKACGEALERAGLRCRIELEIVMGRRLDSIRRLVEDHAVDMVVMNTKARDQLSMLGLAYPLAVELRDVPLLML